MPHIRAGRHPHEVAMLLAALALGAAGMWHSDGAHLLDAGQVAEWMWVQSC